jgi:hypothetical protein
MNTTVQRYETGISENNLKNWSELESVKEFIQNAVYAKTILNDKMSINHDGEWAIINNFPSGFSKSKLLIGESNQSGVAGAPGEFGEGMKMAMAVALRCGLNVMVTTNGFTVIPKLEPSTLDPNVRVLVFYIEDHDDYSHGTTFKINCSKEVLEEAKSYFAVLNGVQFESVSQDGIIEGVDNTVFVNGVKITEIPSIFSYNFTGSELMNRDRSSIDMNRVKSYVRMVLSDVKDIKVAETVIKGIMKNDNLLESQSGIMEYAADEVTWKTAVQNVFGDKIALGTGGESDTQARYRRFKVLTNIPSAWRFFFSNRLGIPYTSDLQQLAQKVKRVHRKPSKEESANLGWAKRLISMYYGDYGTVRISEDLRDQYGNKCWGLYDGREDVIWLDKSILSSKEKTFKVLLHETIHRVTGASDNTEAFTEAWEHACWMILTRGKGE